MLRALVGFIMAPLLVIVLAIVALQFEWLAPGSGFYISLSVIALWMFVGLILTLVGILRAFRGRSRWGRLFALGLIPWAILGGVILLQNTSAPIVMSNDISTDLIHPPGISTGPSAQRGISKNTREIQRKIYSDLRALELERPAHEVFKATVSLGKSLGWEIVAEDMEAGTSEWVVRSRIFRFQDDVSLRITRRDDKTYLDIRSRSRLGKSDLGANAARIRRFFRELNLLFG